MSLAEKQAAMRARMRAQQDATKQSDAMEHGNAETALSLTPPEPLTRRCGNPSCINETSNPRFCSKSCAAPSTTSYRLSADQRVSVNDAGQRSEPKTSFVLTANRFVEVKKKEEEKRRHQSYQSWPRPSGDKSEAPIQRVSTIASFKTHDTLLKLQDKAGTLADRLIGICFSRPRYLRKQDATRYISLLHELKEFTTYDVETCERPCPRIHYYILALGY